MTNSEQVPSTGISSHEEADTIMMIHALEIVQTNKENVVDFFTQDTDLWVLILRRLPELGLHSAIVTGTSINRQTVVLQPIYDKLCSEICSVLPGFHTITGADITGRIHPIMS